MVTRTGPLLARRCPGVMLPAGLLAVWDLTTGVASPIPNRVSGGTALTLAAAPNDPMIGATGLAFDGADDFASSGEYPLGASGTIFVVAKPAASFPSADATYKYRGLLAKTLTGGTAGFAYSLEWQGDNAQRYLRIIVSDGSANNVLPVSYDFGGAFRLITGRWGPASGKVSLWANAAKLAEMPQTVNANAALSTPLKVGQVFNVITNAWSGTIAFAGLYTRELADAEIGQLYKALKARLAPRGVTL